MPPDNANAQHIQGPGGRADRRESIWSVGEPWRWLYFTFFLLLMGAGSSLVGWDTLFGEGADRAWCNRCWRRSWRRLRFRWPLPGCRWG